MLCRIHECRALQGSSNAAGDGTEGTAERRDAQERPLFALRVDNFSGREWALPGSAHRARTRDGPSQKGHGWTFSTICQPLTYCCSCCNCSARAGRSTVVASNVIDLPSRRIFNFTWVPGLRLEMRINASCA